MSQQPPRPGFFSRIASAITNVAASIANFIINPVANIIPQTTRNVMRRVVGRPPAAAEQPSRRIVYNPMNHDDLPIERLLQRREQKRRAKEALRLRAIRELDERRRQRDEELRRDMVVHRNRSIQEELQRQVRMRENRRRHEEFQRRLREYQQNEYDRIQRYGDDEKELNEFIDDQKTDVDSAPDTDVEFYEDEAEPEPSDEDFEEKEEKEEKEYKYHDEVDRAIIRPEERKTMVQRLNIELERQRDLSEYYNSISVTDGGFGTNDPMEIDEASRVYFNQNRGDVYIRKRNERLAYLLERLRNGSYFAFQYLVNERYDINLQILTQFFLNIDQLAMLNVNDRQLGKIRIGAYFPELDSNRFYLMNNGGREILKKILVDRDLDLTNVYSDYFIENIGEYPLVIVVETAFERPIIEGNIIDNNAAGFFPRLNVNPLGIDLSGIQIYSIFNHPQYGVETDINNFRPFPPSDQCVIHCLKQYGIDPSIIERIKLSYPEGAHLDKSKLHTIAQVIKRNIRVTFYRNKIDEITHTDYDCGVDTPSGVKLELALYDDHIFVNYPTPYSKGYLKAHGVFGKYDPRGIGLDTLHLVKYMDKMGWFVYSPLISQSMGNSEPPKAIITAESIEQEQIHCKHNLKKDAFKDFKKAPILFVADFEADTCYDTNLKLTEALKAKKMLEDHIELYGAQIDCKPLQIRIKLLSEEIAILIKQCYHTALYAGVKEIYSDKAPMIIQWETPQESIVQGMMNFIVSQTISKGKEHKRAIVYFHNLKYDFHLMLKQLNIKNICEKTGTIYSVTAKYKGVTIEFRDSFKMISSALSKFGDMFNFPANMRKKEAMAYNYYTIHNKHTHTVELKEYMKFLKPEEHKVFREILSDPTLARKFSYVNVNGVEQFDPVAYYHYYLEYDCRVLAEGLKCFNQQIRILTGDKINMFNYLTISSLAHDIMTDSGAYDNVWQVQGCLRAFIHEGIYGGRVLVNPKFQKKLIEDDIEDFDGVSLYPSAMYRLCREYGIPAGKCQMLRCTDEMKIASYYVVKIMITKVNKKQNMPMITHRGDGSMKYLNDPPSEIKEGKEVPKAIVVDKYTLEDWIRFHGIEYIVLEGVYWNEGFNKEMGTCIKRLFDMRVQMKRDRNTAMSEVLKLLMNSVYGKTMPKLMKERNYIVNDERWKKEEDGTFTSTKGHLDQYVMNHYHTIKKYQLITPQIANVTRYEYDGSSDLSHVGCMILSMSRRIMNEVFDVANDNNIDIFYQDTDSMHLRKRDVDGLASQYRVRYNKELIGENLEQFHTDFNMKGCRDVYSIRSIFIDKKIYFDQLRGINAEGEIKYEPHFRAKGFTTEGWKKCCNEKFGGEMQKMYEYLCLPIKSEGVMGREPLEIDLAAGGDKFMLNTNKMSGVYTKMFQTRTI
jgi:hypothetical protein